MFWLFNVKMKKMLLTLLLLFSMFSLFSCNGKNNLILNGDSDVTIEVGEKYIEEGTNKADYVVVGEVNSYKVGTYTLEYYFVNDKGDKSASIFRVVRVTDTKPPTYELKENLEVSKGNFKEENLFKWVADNSNGEISYSSNFEDIVVEENRAGIYTITVTISDESGNETDVPVVINYLVSDWDILYGYISQNGNLITDNEGEQYYKFEFDEEGEEFTIEMYKDSKQTITLEMKSFIESGASAVVRIVAAKYNKILASNLVMFYLYDENGELEGLGYDDDALIRLTYSIVIFDHSNFGSMESAAEKLTETMLTEMVQVLKDYFENTIKIDFS